MKRQIYQFKITLKGGKPTIWRRFQILNSSNFQVLHQVIQTVMGWADYHLFEFIIDDYIHIADSEMIDDEFEEIIDFKIIKIGDYIIEKGDKLLYIYDFGDGWHHQIILEKIFPFNKSFKHPICLGGKRACPPEDSGGIGGYYWNLRVMKDPNNPDHEHIKEWMGDFDTEYFDIEDTNNALKKIKL